MLNYEEMLPENITKENVLKMIYTDELQKIEEERRISLQPIYDVKFNEFVRRSVLTINRKKQPLKFIKHMTINYALDMVDHVIKEVAMRSMKPDDFNDHVNKSFEKVMEDK